MKPNKLPDVAPLPGFWSRVLDLVGVLLRFPVVVFLVPVAILAGVLRAIGTAGEWLHEVCDNAVYAMAAALNPRAWKLMERLKEERDMFERDLALVRDHAEFWRKEAQKKQA